MSYKKYIEKAEGKNYKTCSMCGRFLHTSEYGEGLAACKSCSAARYVTCRYCHEKKPEKELEIYYVIEDMYFCNQLHADAYNGFRRNQKGFIYRIKDENGKWPQI